MEMTFTFQTLVRPKGTITVKDGPDGRRLGEASQWTEIEPGLWQGNIVFDDGVDTTPLEWRGPVSVDNRPTADQLADEGLDPK